MGELSSPETAMMKVVGSLKGAECDNKNTLQSSVPIRNHYVAGLCDPGECRGTFVLNH